MILDTILFIVYYRTASAAVALKSVKTAAARRAAVLLRLRQRARGMLFEIAERAHYLEQEGVDRKVAVEQLVSEFRVKLEEELRRVRTIFNFVVMSAAMVIMMGILLGVILGILSPLASQYATALVALLLFPLYALEPFLPPHPEVGLLAYCSLLVACRCGLLRASGRLRHRPRGSDIRRVVLHPAVRGGPGGVPHGK